MPDSANHEPHEPEKAIPPRILVIRGGAIGDFILTLPALKLLREAFPAAQIEILGYKHIIALAEKRFYADSTRSIEYAALSSFFIPNATLPPDLLEYFASFKLVISYLYDPDGFFAANLQRAGVSHLIEAFSKIETAIEAKETLHATQHLARPLENLALYLEEKAATIYPSDEDRAFASDFLRTILTKKPQLLIAIHPGSGSHSKNWPLENWKTLGAHLIKNGAQILLIGGEAESEILSPLANFWNSENTQIAKALPLPQLAALLQQSSGFIGHDSGISHLAAAAGTRCLLLFGPTNPAVWAPANRDVRLLHAANGDLAELKIETVAAEIRWLLADPKH